MNFPKSLKMMRARQGMEGGQQNDRCELQKVRFFYLGPSTYDYTQNTNTNTKHVSNPAKTRMNGVTEARKGEFRGQKCEWDFKSFFIVIAYVQKCSIFQMMSVCISVCLFVCFFPGWVKFSKHTHTDTRGIYV